MDKATVSFKQILKVSVDLKWYLIQALSMLDFATSLIVTNKLVCSTLVLASSCLWKESIFPLLLKSIPDPILILFSA